MAAKSTKSGFGGYVYGLGVMALAGVCLAFGGFDPGQPVPKAFPDRTILAYAAAAFMLVAGAAVMWRRAAAWASGALAAYYALIVVVLMNGRVMLAHPTEYVSYSGAAEQLAIAAGALILFAASGKLDAGLRARITRLGQITFGLCAIIFVGAHFAYLGFTAPLAPKWLPGSQVFWAYATGVAHIAGGLAIIAGFRARLAAILLTVMYASFTPLVHVPLLLADHTSHENWAENAENIALVGVAWVVADSLAGRTRR